MATMVATLATTGGEGVAEEAIAWVRVWAHRRETLGGKAECPSRLAWEEAARGVSPRQRAYLQLRLSCVQPLFCEGGRSWGHHRPTLERAIYLYGLPARPQPLLG